MHGEPAALARAARPAGRDRGRRSCGCRSRPGASAVQLFDSWAGALSRGRLRAVRAAAQPGRARVAGRRRRAADPLRGRHRRAAGRRCARPAPTWSASTGGCRWTRRRAGSGRAPVVQGNLDPALLLRRLAGARAARCAGSSAEGRAAAGHIFNLGHGVLPDTDPGRADPGRRARPLAATPDGRAARRSWSSAAASPGWPPPGELADRGPTAEVIVLEAAAAVGGKLRRAEVAGVPVDVGAEAMLARRPEGVDLIHALGLGRRADHSADHRRRRCAAGGANHPLPARTMMGVPADLGRAARVRRAERRRAGPGRRRAGAPAASRRWPRTSRSVRWSRAARATRSSTGWSSRCSAASTPAGPTSCRCAATMPALAAAAAPRRRLAASRRPRRSPRRPRRPAGPARCSSRCAGGLARLAADARREPGASPCAPASPCARSRGRRPASRSTAARCPTRRADRRRRGDRGDPGGQGGAAAARARPGGGAELAGIETASMAIVTLAFAGVDAAAGQRPAGRLGRAASRSRR